MSLLGRIFRNSEATDTVLISPFKIGLNQALFCDIKTQSLFKKMLNRVYSRVEGAIDKDKIQSIFDSSEKSGALTGLISILAEGMEKRKRLILIYDSGIVRKANIQEAKKIEDDYEKFAKSTRGIIVDFKNYWLADLIKAYMSMTYDIITSMNTQVGLAKALQIKISALRGTVSAAGKDDPINQAKEINQALTSGRSVLLDKNDAVESLKIDSGSVEAGIKLVNNLIAAELGVSTSFVNGELTTGMSATGEADVNADEYGFQDMFNSIFKPVCDRLYGWNLQFVTDDWRYTGAMLDKLIIVENSSILSDEQKTAYAQRAIPLSTK